MTNRAWSHPDRDAVRHPTFVLKVPDPLAPGLVTLWAAINAGEFAAAARAFAGLLTTADEAGGCAGYEDCDGAARVAAAMHAIQNDEPWCRTCLCTEHHACNDPVSGPCAWADAARTLCTACAGEPVGPSFGPWLRRRLRERKS